MKNTDAAIHPFPGLRPFDEDEEYLFFGREKSVTELLSRLRTSRFLAVIGTSGSGKSSLVKAGLLPALYRGFMAGVGSHWRVALFRPGDNPIGNLARVLGGAGILCGDVDRSDDETGHIYGKLIEATLRRSHRGLIDVVRQARLPEHENLLVVVDQFEEIFRFSKLERSKQDVKRDSAAFIKMLLESCSQTEFPIYIILTMRSDFLGDCTEFRDLPEAINRGQYLIPRMTRDEKRDAVAGPVAVGEGEISPTLLARLLNDVGERLDHLPILQHSLMRTWDYWVENRKQGEPLDLSHYDAVGTMESALSQHAEEAYGELKTEKSRSICEKMFKLLTDKGETGRGVRRPAKVREICLVSKASEKEVIQVINVFRQPGRTFLMPPIGEKLRADSVIDISHESLMRIWTRLIDWVKEEAKSADLYMHLSKTARLYGEGKASLFRDPELMLALKWRDEQRPNDVWAGRYDPSFDRAIEFLEASKKQQENEIKEKEREQRAKIRNARILTIVISFAALISIVFGIWAFHSKGIADRLRDEHKAVASDNVIKTKEALYQKQRAELKTKEANEQKEKAIENAEKAKQEREKAERNAFAAKRAEALARKSAWEAKESEIKEKIQSYIVELNKKRADFRQYLGKAKELAVHSIAQRKDKELKALLALTAFRLNEKAYKYLERSTKETFEKFDKKTLDNFAGNRELAEEYEKLNEVYEKLQNKSKKLIELPEIFIALRDAYITREDGQDIIYESAESWALAAAGNNKFVFNDREGELLCASLQPAADVSKLPVLNKKETMRLANNSILQAGSFVETDKWLFCGTRTGSLIYWAKSDWKMKRLPEQHDVKILSMAFAKNNTCLFYSVENKIVRHKLHSPHVGEAEVVIRFEESNYIRALTIIEDNVGSFLIAADAKGSIYHYDLAEDTFEKERLNANVESSGFFAIAYDTGAKLLSLANSKGEIFLFPDVGCNSLKSGTKIQSCRISQKHKGIVRVLTFSPGGSFLASGGLDGTIMLWDVKGGSGSEITKQAPVLTFESKLKILSLIFDAAEEHMIFCDERNLRICPTSPESFFEKLCRHKIRKFKKDEWEHYVGESFKQEDFIICPQGKEQ